jgi:RNA polymerase subunit RPABC4/transcription elongation factor Spt4
MKCSKCGNEFDGNFCPNCGSPASETDSPQVRKYSPKATTRPFWDKMVTCKTCRKQIAKTAKRCPYCGAKQHQGALTACYLIVIFTVISVFWIIGSSFQGGSTATIASQAANTTNNASGTSSKANGRITKAAYDKIKNGMTYDEVKEIIGSDGKNIFESGDKGTDSYQISYMWLGENGGEATIGFSGKSELKVLLKSQSELK